jgi:hypothetical protein
MDLAVPIRSYREVHQAGSVKSAQRSVIALDRQMHVGAEVDVVVGPETPTLEYEK